MKKEEEKKGMKKRNNLLSTTKKRGAIKDEEFFGLQEVFLLSLLHVCLFVLSSTFYM